ncbi:MAG TPA: FAD:protein FMN transferase [Candidatus Saccharimonadales bacterium]|nr:FAD:protein FMN transferase [Candidatus Saccharimonadales bacterium]
MRQVAQIMGMPISIDIPSCSDDKIFETIFKWFKQVDERFSPFKKNSELSKYNRGEFSGSELSSDMRDIIESCNRWKEITGGYFSAWYNQEFDPSGYVKGWSIKKAGNLINGLGFKTYCIGAGGDIMACSDGQKEWTIGIQDPGDVKKILKRLSIKNSAVATSGTYERGKHIINPKTCKPADEFMSVSIIGPDIITADVLSTTLFAMGNKGIEFVSKFADYDAVFIAA